MTTRCLRGEADDDPGGGGGDARTGKTRVGTSINLGLSEHGRGDARVTSSD